MNVREQLAADTQAAIGGYGSSFTWTSPTVDGAQPITIPCVRRDNPSALEILNAGGEVDQSVFSLSVARSDLAALAPELLARAASLEAIGDGVNGASAQIGWINGGQDTSSPRVLFLCKSFDNPHGGPMRG